MAYTTNPQYYQDGELVAAAVANRPLIQLQGNTDYLLSLFSSFSSKYANIQTGVSMSTTVAVGNPVYWNSGASNFQPAQAVAGLCDVVGVCVNKTTTTSGDIVTNGYVSNINILSIIDGSPVSVVAGWYFLSSATAGNYMTTVDPDISVPVAIADGAGNIWVRPTYRNTPPNTIETHGAACISTLAVGNPVFWSSANSRFEAAKAGVNNSVLGVCVRKPTSTTADVILRGKIPLSFNSLIDGGGSAQIAQYYVSTQTAGNVTTTRDAVNGIPIFFADGAGGNVYVDSTVAPLPPFSLTSATGTTTDSYAAAATLANTTGIHCTGSIKNTGANPMTVQISATDAYGTNDTSVTSSVAASNSYVFSSTAAAGTALPPMTSFIINVKSTNVGQATTYSIKTSSN